MYNCRRQTKPRYVWFATAQKKKEKKKLLQSSYERNSPPVIPVTAAKNKLTSEQEERRRDQFTEALNNQLCTVEEAFHCEIFRSIYLKVKIMIKDDNKRSMYEETLN